MSVRNSPVFAALVLGLSGCALFDGSITPQTVAAFTLADLQAADAAALANNDVVADTCYKALLPVIEAQNTALTSAGALPGAISLFQAGRNLQTATGGSGAIGVACAPLMAQTQGSVLDLGKLFGL